MTGDNRRPVIVGLGEILWDLLPEGRQLGGAPANFAYHAHALGAQAFPVSCVGNDEPGREILERLEQLELPPRYVSIDPDHPTGTVDVAIDEKGHPRFTIHEEVAWDYIPQTRSLEALAARTDAVAFGTLAQRGRVSRTTIRAFLSATRETCLRIFDVNLRQAFYREEIVRTLLTTCDVVKLNDEELPVIRDMLDVETDLSAGLASLVERYKLRLAVLTRGEHGSILRSAEGESVHPGVQVNVVDTVGAGDAFTAAVAIGMLHGRDQEWIQQFATEVASFVCTQAGATPPLPDELRRRLND